MTHDLSEATLVYIAPRSGTNGVSDYADDMLGFARERMSCVIEVRHGGSSEDGVADVLRGRREIKRALAGARGPVILHAEQSGGVLLPFWGLLGNRATVRSATVHDAPLSIWLPFRTKLVSRNRFVQHGLHYPILPLLERFERRAMRDVLLFALTRSGVQATQKVMRHRSVKQSFLPVPDRPELPTPTDRPLAVGLFGYVYRGKGFERLVELRRLIDDHIDIRVAGRGTESLDPVAGVTVLGGVEGPDEDAFFASIRAMIVPYGKRSSYGPETHVASSTITRALAYQTPVIALRYNGIDDEALIVGDIAELAATVNRLLTDDDELAVEAARADLMRRRLTTEQAFERYAVQWRAALAAVDA